MKNIPLLFILLFSLNAFAQQKDSTNVSPTDSSVEVKVFASGGVIFINYSVDYVNFLISNSKNFEQFSFSSTVSKNLSASFFSAGFEITSGKHKMQKHVIELGYFSFKSSYSNLPNLLSYNNYGAYSYITNTDFYQQSITLSYKYQPTYKWLFCSIGIIPTYNFISHNDVIRIGYHFPGVETNPDGSFSFAESYSSGKVNYLVVPFQFGAGFYIKLGKLTCKPAAYFTPMPMKGLYIFNTSLVVLYSTKSTKPLCHN